MAIQQSNMELDTSINERSEPSGEAPAALPVEGVLNPNN